GAGPAKGREGASLSREVGAVVSFSVGLGALLAAEFGRIDEADVPGSFGFGGGGEQFVLAEAALFAAAALDVFHGFEAFEVKAGLGFAPAGFLADLAAGEQG